jgi:DNA-binding winged helix-turn-helix (wHTH) protein
VRYQFNHCDLDANRYQPAPPVHPVSINPVVFDLLVYLIENWDRFVAREELLDNLWKSKADTDAALGARLKDAHKVVGDDGCNQAVFKTLLVRGYQFVAIVRQTAIDRQPVSEDRER